MFSFSLNAGVIHYLKNAEGHGVFYALGTNFGATTWKNPGKTQALSTMRIIATRSSNYQGDATDLLENRGKKASGTEDEPNSWWCVDLTEKYALYPTHYTLRHAPSLPIIRNWRLEGSLDKSDWKTLKAHKDDRRLYDLSPYHTVTWSLEGKFMAFQYFRILQTGKNSKRNSHLFLSGMELYGVLIEKDH